MPRLRDPLKARSVRLQVSCTTDEVQRVKRLAKRLGVKTISRMGHQCLVAGLEAKEKEVAA